MAQFSGAHRSKGNMAGGNSWGLKGCSRGGCIYIYIYRCRWLTGAHRYPLWFVPPCQSCFRTCEKKTLHKTLFWCFCLGWATGIMLRCTKTEIGGRLVLLWDDFMWHHWTKRTLVIRVYWSHHHQRMPTSWWKRSTGRYQTCPNYLLKKLQLQTPNCKQSWNNQQSSVKHMGSRIQCRKTW